MNLESKEVNYDDVLKDPERLELIYNLDLIDTLPEEVFDRLTRLASKLLPTPVALVSIVDDKRQFFKSFIGLDEPWSTKRETPLSHSFCQHVVATGKPLIVNDAREHQLVKDNLAIPDLGVISYLGMPIILRDGLSLGSFCVIDSEARNWSPEDIEAVHDLAQSVITEIELRREVRALKESEAQREQLVRELRSVNRDLADFAYIVSHDLKAPLRGIRSIADWLTADYSDVIDEDGKELLALMQARVGRLQSLIEGVLKYSRVGRIEDEWELVDLQHVVEMIVESLDPPEHIDISIPDTLPTVFGGQVRLGQVFQNLLSNAIKFMDKPEGFITVTVQKLDQCWQFEVIDNGPGIDERHFGKIFQMFNTLNARDDLESTGIGLTIVKKIVEMHGGKITVESEVGIGTTFRFTIASVEDPA